MHPNVLITHPLNRELRTVALHLPLLTERRLVDYMRPSTQDQPWSESLWVKDPATHCFVLDGEARDRRKYEVRRVLGAMILMTKLWNLRCQIVVVSNHEHAANAGELRQKLEAVKMAGLVSAFAVIPPIDWKGRREVHPLNSLSESLLQAMRQVIPDIIVGNFDDSGQILAAYTLGLVGKDEARIWMAMKNLSERPAAKEELNRIFVIPPTPPNGGNPTPKQWEKLLAEVQSRL